MISADTAVVLPGRCQKCLHDGRCRTCLVPFSDVEGGGKRHFCLEGIESIPKHKHARADEPMELKPQRFSTKRQKMMDKINSSGSEAKRLAEVQKALRSYVNKEEDEVERSSFS